MFEIQKAQQEDISFVKQIEMGCGLSPWSETDYLQEVIKEDSLFFVAKQAGKVVGFILARLIMIYDKPYSNEIEIYNLAIIKQYRRRFVASDLLDRVSRIAFEKGARSIFLEVRKSNLGAQTFYLKHSFIVCGERKNFYTNPLEDAVLMSRLLKSI